MRLTARRAAVRTFAAAALSASASGGVAAQEVNVWLDGNAVHARPPAGTVLDAASFGLLGLRVHASGRGRSGELGASLGRGTESGSGGWAGGRAAVQASQVRGRLDAGVRLEGSGLRYLTAVQLGEDVEYMHGIVQATMSPWLGVSAGSWRVGADAAYGAGAWRNELTRTVVQSGPGLGPGPPVTPPGLPPVGGGTQRKTDVTTGSTALVGGSVSLMRVLRGATLEVRASGYEVSNQVADGWYSGVDGNLALSLGDVDLSAGIRRWQTPADSAEVGGHVGVGMQAGPSAYVRLSASRTVADLTYGAPAGTSLSAGVALRVGRRTLGPPAPAQVGVAASTGRLVTFTLRHRNARSVAVAGDFSGWEPRALQRGSDGVWTLDTTLPPGVYHYAFIVDGETWLVPDHATGIVDDGFGQRNATLVVSASPDL